MASFTSRVTFGYWSDPSSWLMNGSPATRPPREGDSVTIQAGHTIVFDADLSGFPNGLAGLTINGTLLIPSLNDPSYQEVGEETSGTPWLSGWSYRRTVYVDNSFSSTPLTDFQIIIRLNTAYLILQGKMRLDCGDIRVTDSSGNLLPIWIDPDTKNMWNTKIFVKVPSIPANSVVTLYLFYGNPDATDVSDGNSVFDFFDDFSGNSLDTNKWTAARWAGTGSWSVMVGNGYVEINSGSGTRAGIVSKIAFALPFIVEGSFRYVSGDQVWNSITQTAGGSHNDLVEHGYGSTGETYFYRRANGGTYHNYQSFGRFAPRGGFAYFRQEWTTSSSRYFEFFPRDEQVNSTTTQDRYTSGSCHIQLSTIGGVAQWDWVAVRKFAATPPAVYFRTLTTTTLKVHANIAGTGSFLIGSSSYSINYPQWTKIMVNGSITVANFNCYGEQRSPLWDYLAQDAAAGSTTIVLQNGLPLRSGDLIAIGRSDIVDGWGESSTTRGLYTVASYNPDTKTVTLNEALTPGRSGTGVRACLVILLSRQIVISKYGATNVALLRGSGRTIQGVSFEPEGGATVRAIEESMSSSSFSNVSSRFMANGYLWGSSLSFNNVVSFGHTTFYGTGISSVSNVAIINALFFMDGGGIVTFNNIHLQNTRVWQTPVSVGFTFIFNNLTLKNSNFATQNSYGRPIFYINDCLMVDGNLAFGLHYPTQFYINNLSWFAFLNNNYTFYTASTTGGDILVIKNSAFQHNASGRSIILVSGGICTSILLINCSFSASSVTLCSNNTSLARFIGCSISNAANPILSNYWSHASEIINLTTNAYYRPILSIPPSADVLSFNRFTVKGLTVAGVQHPKAFEHLFPHGYAKNRWDAATPDYTTFDFRLTQSSLAGRPIWLEYQVFTADQVRVTGTITQLGTNESVKVQIFSANKEPLYGDTPDFEQTYTSAGDISVNWTPTDQRTWVVRVLAYPQQTTSPITIANLQVAGGRSGGGGSGDIVNIQVSDQMGVLAGEAIQAQLAIQQAINAAISSSEQVSPILTTTVDDTAVLQSVDSVIAQFNLLPSELVQVLASEVVQSSLQASVSEVMQASVQDTVLSQLLASPSETVRILTEESVLPSIAVAATDMTQVRTDESQVVQVGVGVSESLRISTAEQATPVISFALTESQQVLASEGVNVFTGFQLLVSDSMQVATLESQSTNIAAQIVQQELIQTSEAPTTQLGVSIADSASVSSAESIIPTLQPRVSENVQVSASESQSVGIAINFTQQESVRASEAPSAQIGIAVADQAIAVVSEIASQTIIPQISETMRISASEQPSVAMQVAAATTAQVRTTESVSPSVQLAASETGQVLASESSSAQIAGLISEIIRVSTSEQTTTQVQFSAVESVTQIEAETAPFVGLIQRLMIPVSVDLLKAVELSISITQVR